jgi:hypothetical protein
MSHRLIDAFVITGLSLAAMGPRLVAQTIAADDQSAAKAEIRNQVNRYMQSVDDADTTLGAQVWSATPDVTFIEPTGHECGWDQIAAVVYGKLMGATFSKRTLKNVGEVSIHVYANAAVAEYDWDFVATLRSDGKTVVHTTGRESQVYVNLQGQGWRLVHVHYSGPPVSEPGGPS